MAKKLTEEEATSRAIEMAKNAGLIFIDFDGGRYVRAKGVVNLICREHGELKITFDKLKCGTRCKKCNDKRSAQGRKTPQRKVVDFISSICLKNDWDFIGFDGGEFSTVDGLAVLSCRKHGEFRRRIADLKSRDYKCPKCSWDIKSLKNRMPEDEAIKRWNDYCSKFNLAFNGFVVPYESADKTRVFVECEEHGEYETSYSNSVIRDRGCPGCSRGGFSHSLDGFVYALSGSGFIKIGISNHPERRIKRLRPRTPFDFDVVEVIKLKNGYEARKIEKRMHTKFESAGLSGFDGATEWLKFNPEILAELRAL